MSADTHPDWELLLKAVVAAPADDLPRLVAADWLDDHNEPERAEFIRVQIQRTRPPRPELSCRELMWREIALRDNPLFGGLWALEACPGIVTLTLGGDGGSPLRAVGVGGTDQVTFRRGFPELVRCPAAAWLDHGHRVVPRQPVREVQLTACDAVPVERWWDGFDTLRRLDIIDIRTRSAVLPTWLRERLGDRVEVRANGRPASTLLLAESRPSILDAPLAPLPRDFPPMPDRLPGIDFT